MALKKLEKPEKTIGEQKDTSQKFIDIPYRVELTNTEREDREKLFPIITEQYYQSINPRLNKLREWRDMYDMDVSGIKQPWDDAIRIKPPMVRQAIKAILSKIHRLFWSRDKIIKATPKDEDNIKNTTKYENWATHKLKRVIDIEKAMKSVEFNALEDATGIAEVYMDHTTKRMRETQVYKSLEEFKKDFPSADKSNIDEDQYRQHTRDLKEGKQARIPVITEKELSFHPKVRSIEREDFLLIPAESIGIEEAKGCGKVFIMAKSEIQQAVDDERFDEIPDEAWDKIKPIREDRTQLQSQKQAGQGVKESDDRETYKDPSYYVIELIWRDKIGKDTEERDYIHTYMIDKKEHPTACRILQTLEYMYEHGQRKYSRILFEERKSKQFDGVSIAEILRHEDTLVGEALSVWVNWWKIKLAPPIAVKEEGSFDAEEQDIEPAALWYLRDPKEDVNIVNIAGTGTPDSLNIIGVGEKMGELSTGIGARNTGVESPRDPRAPAAKTAMLLREGNQIVADGAETMVITGLNRVVYQCLQLCYQYATEDEESFIKGYDKEGKAEFDTMKTEEMKGENLEVHFELATSTMNRDVDKMEYLEFLKVWLPNDQSLLTDPFKLNLLMKHYMELDESPIRHELILTNKELEQRQARIMAMAMKMKEDQARQEKEQLQVKTQQWIKQRRKELIAGGMSKEKAIEQVAKEAMEIRNRMAENKGAPNAGQQR